MRRSITSSAALAIIAALSFAACGSDAPKSSPTTAASTTPTTVLRPITTAATTVRTDVATPSTEPTSTGASTEPSTTDPTSTTIDTTTPSTDAPTTTTSTTTPTTVPPDALQQLPGLATLAVTAAGDDPTRPTFSWAAVAGAAGYELVVQGADGTPVWAWTGADTSIVLGGADHTGDVEGPTLAGPSRVRVYALAGDQSLVAVSGWVALPG
ncbi:MAG: hypothetical protein JWM34_4312 [Ilumatobacteraceae bacterium]|nr:hypothetical protein [Ilumatobacteraceae bacterium]